MSINGTNNKTMFQQIKHNINKQPRKLFFVDGVGALVSAFFLAFVLAKFKTVFGMPSSALYLLSFIACIFALYSFSCYWFINKNWQPFLKIIAIANLMYGILSIGFVVYFYARLSWLGLLYFVLELMIIFTLVSIELKTVHNYQ